MTDLHEQIGLLEEQGNSSELLALLACDPQTRRRNRLLAGILCEQAQVLRRQVCVDALRCTGFPNDALLHLARRTPPHSGFSCSPSLAPAAFS